MDNNEEIIEDLVEETTEETVSEPEVELSETEKLQAELDAKQDTYLRLTAEYDNFRKRSIKDRETAFNNAVSFSAEAMLPVYDTLTMAINQAGDDENHKKGLELTLKQLEDGFAKLGIVQIEDAPGTKFDANLHNAVMHIDDDSLEENVIAETFQKGFKIGEKVIRYSTCKVAN